MFYKYRIQGNAAFHEEDMEKASILYQKGFLQILRLSKMIKMSLCKRECHIITDSHQIYTKNISTSLRKKIIRKTLFEILKTLCYEASLHAVNLSTVFLRTKRIDLALIYCKYAYFTYRECFNNIEVENKQTNEDISSKVSGHSNFIEQFLLDRLCITLLHSGYLRSFSFYFQNIQNPSKRLQCLLQNCNNISFEDYTNRLDMISVTDMADMPRQANSGYTGQRFNNFKTGVTQNQTRNNEISPFNLPLQESLRRYLESYLEIQKNEQKIKQAQKNNRKKRIIECLGQLVSKKQETFKRIDRNIIFPATHEEDEIKQDAITQKMAEPFAFEDVYEYKCGKETNSTDMHDGKDIFIKFVKHQNDEAQNIQNQSESVENKETPNQSILTKNLMQCDSNTISRHTQSIFARSTNHILQSSDDYIKKYLTRPPCPFFDSKYKSEYYGLTFNLLSPQFILNTAYLFYKMNANSFNIGYVQNIQNNNKGAICSESKCRFHSACDDQCLYEYVPNKKTELYETPGLYTAETSIADKLVGGNQLLTTDMSRYPIDDMPTEEETELINEYRKKNCINIQKLNKLDQKHHIYTRDKHRTEKLFSTKKDHSLTNPKTNEIGFTDAQNTTKSFSDNNVYIFGDTHGNLPNTYLTIRTITENFCPFFNGAIVINGDIVDRGEFSIELVVFFYILMIYYDLSDSDCDGFECYFKERHIHKIDQQGVGDENQLLHNHHETHHSCDMGKSNINNSLNQRKNFNINEKPPLKNTHYDTDDIIKINHNEASVFPMLLRIENHILYKMPLKTTTKRIFINRGNHEFRSVNKKHTLYSELRKKYPFYHNIIFNLVNYSFRSLILCTIVDQIMVVHGGIPHKHENVISLIEQIDRKVEVFRRKPCAATISKKEVQKDQKEIADMTKNENITHDIASEAKDINDTTIHEKINNQDDFIDPKNIDIQHKAMNQSDRNRQPNGSAKTSRFDASIEFYTNDKEKENTASEIYEEVKNDEMANCLRVALYNKKLNEMVKGLTINVDNSIKKYNKPKEPACINYYQAKSIEAKNIKHKNTLFIKEEFEKLYRKMGLSSKTPDTNDEEEDKKSSKSDVSPENNPYMSSMLWSDPRPTLNNSASARGLGQYFGLKSAMEFLVSNNMIAVVRSHEYRPAMERITSEILEQSIKDGIKQAVIEEIHKKDTNSAIPKTDENNVLRIHISDGRAVEQTIPFQQTQEKLINEPECRSGKVATTPSCVSTEKEIFHLRTDSKPSNSNNTVYLTIYCHKIAEKVVEHLKSDMSLVLWSTHGHIFTVFSSVDYFEQVNEAVFIMVRNGRYGWYLME